MLICGKYPNQQILVIQLELLFVAARLSENCVIRQNVTIGQKNREDESAVIGNKVDIGAGAIILGPVNIGDDCIIAAGAIVLESVPPRSTYYSKFTSIIKRNG